MIRRACRTPSVTISYLKANVSLLPERKYPQVPCCRARRHFSSDRSTGMDLVSPFIGLTGKSIEFDQQYDYRNHRKSRTKIISPIQKYSFALPNT